jgi:hypothetical protein
MAEQRELFEKFMDLSYYSKLELCGDVVMVSFSKYFPWEAMHSYTTLCPLPESVNGVIRWFTNFSNCPRSCCTLLKRVLLK